MKLNLSVGFMLGEKKSRLTEQDLKRLVRLKEKEIIFSHDIEKYEYLRGETEKEVIPLKARSKSLR